MVAEGERTERQLDYPIAGVAQQRGHRSWRTVAADSDRQLGIQCGRMADDVADETQPVGSPVDRDLAGAVGWWGGG